MKFLIVLALLAVAAFAATCPAGEPADTICKQIEMAPFTGRTVAGFTGCEVANQYRATGVAIGEPEETTGNGCLKQTKTAGVAVATYDRQAGTCTTYASGVVLAKDSTTYTHTKNGNTKQRKKYVSFKGCEVARRRV